jgi:hypothetical protein
MTSVRRTKNGVCAGTWMIFLVLVLQQIVLIMNLKRYPVPFTQNTMMKL